MIIGKGKSSKAQLFHASDGRKARKHRRLLSHLQNNRCLDVVRDVVSRRESSVRTPAFGVHPALLNALSPGYYESFCLKPEFHR